MKAKFASQTKEEEEEKVRWCSFKTKDNLKGVLLSSKSMLISRYDILDMQKKKKNCFKLTC